MAAPVIERAEFRAWLATLADNEDVCGRAGEGFACPIAQFYLTKGYRGFAGRLCFFLGDERHSERTPYQPWAEIFISRCDLEFRNPEDNGWVLIPAQSALAVLDAIADENVRSMRAMREKGG